MTMQMEKWSGEEEEKKKHTNRKTNILEAGKESLNWK